MAAASATLSTLADFARAFAEPFAAAKVFKQEGGRVIGYMTANAPVELIEAAGMFPLRLDGGGVADTPKTDAFMERLFDPTVRGACERLLSGELDFLDAVVLPRTVDSVQRLYYYLCEQERTGAAKPPMLVLYDLLHTPFYSSAEHNYSSLLRLSDALGAKADDVALSEAIAASNQRRAVLQQCIDAGLSGVERLHLIAASQRMLAAGFNTIVASLPTALAGRKFSGTRVVLAGNGPDTDDLHRAIEAAGCVVVGDYHDRGDLSLGAPIDETLPPMRAISEHYHRATASARTFPAKPEALAAFAAERRAEAVIFFFYAEEEVLTWEYPGQRDALAKAGVPSILLAAQPYRINSGQVQAEVASLLTTLKVSA